MDKPFQRKGGKSNTEVGREFEKRVQAFFKSQGLCLERDVTVEIGINGKKLHKFDLGNLDKKVLVECKSHKWTEGGNVPSAKITTWDQAMLYFLASPQGFRKILCVLRDDSPEKKVTLAEYYIQVKGHLIPQDVEIWEYDENKEEAERLNLNKQRTKECT